MGSSRAVRYASGEIWSVDQSRDCKGLVQSHLLYTFLHSQSAISLLGAVAGRCHHGPALERHRRCVGAERVVLDDGRSANDQPALVQYWVSVFATWPSERGGGVDLPNYLSVVRRAVFGRHRAQCNPRSGDSADTGSLP